MLMQLNRKVTRIQTKAHYCAVRFTLISQYKQDIRLVHSVGFAVEDQMCFPRAAHHTGCFLAAFCFSVLISVSIITRNKFISLCYVSCLL